MPVKKVKGQFFEDMVAYSDSAELLSDLLTESEVPFEIKSFDDFVQTICANSYPQHEFNTWHIRLLSHLVDETILDPVSKFLLAVLPRYHLKSTILGYFSMIYRMLTSYGDGVYVSFKDELANYHLSNIKNCVRANQILSKFMIDRSPQSDINVSYKIGAKICRVFGSGILAVKRGIHTDVLLVADDLLGNVENPMVLTELDKAKRIFQTEVTNIPNRDCPMFVFGTPIDYNDLLYSLKDNPNYKSIWLPALYPDAEHDILWEKKYDKEWLQRRKGLTSGEWRAFSTEFLLTPVMATEAFITKEEIDKVIDKTLKNHSVYMPYNKEDKHIVAGFDVGKRRHPSHLSVFVDDNNDNLIMIHQSFLDGIEYNKQIEFLTTAITNFQIDKLYYDNTRSELEDRNLPRRECMPIKFTGTGQRNQNSFAVDFAKRVETKTVSLLDDDRFISQILSLTGDLKAPDSPMGHADSFWSCALAIGAYQDYFAKDRHKGFSYLGDTQELISVSERKIDLTSRNLSDNICKICSNRTFDLLEGGKKICRKCATIW